MRQSLRAGGRAALVLGAAVATAAAAAAQENRPGWYSNIDLTTALTAGNSGTATFGAGGDITWMGLRNSWKTVGSFIRTDVNEPGRRAIGTRLDGSDAVLENGPRTTKSEKIFGNTDFRHRVTERFFWDVGGSLERDIFAGLKARSTGVVGIGYMFDNKTDAKFTAGVGATYTSQNEVIDDPETENQFAGARFTADLERRFGDRKQSTFQSQLVIDENLQTTDDLRANWNTNLAVAMSQHVDLKLGVQFTFDNAPQLVEFPIFVRQGANILETQGRRTGPAEKLDTTLTVSLTFKFAPGGLVSRPAGP